MVRLGSLAGLHATSCFLEVVLSVSASFTLKTDTSWPHNQASCLENYIKEEGLNQLWMCARAQNFVENFSEFSAAQRNAGKHVTLMSELSRLVDARTLMQVEQCSCSSLSFSFSCKMHAWCSVCSCAPRRLCNGGCSMSIDACEARCRCAHNGWFGPMEKGARMNATTNK